MTELCLPPLSLYIHIPWCEKKCPYCDFNSHVSRTIPQAAYIDALLRDAETEVAKARGRTIRSIFIGGGTPSLFDAGHIARLLERLAGLFDFATDIEITMEANPGSSERRKFSSLGTAGINRLSLGVQSFSDNALQALGRVHNSSDALHAVDAAQNAGFDRINIDLMHGLPDQGTKDAVADLEQAIALGVSHISWYQLTIEQNTAFYSQPPLLPVEDTLADIQQAGQGILTGNGFTQYEVSAFCRPGHEARHNMNYWEFGDYLAIGAGSHGKITCPENDQVTRYHKTRLPDDYLARSNDFIARQYTLDKSGRLFECLMNGLRLPAGIAVQDCLARTGATSAELYALCQPLVDQGLLILDDRLSTTDRGFLYLNNVLERLLPA